MNDTVSTSSQSDSAQCDYCRQRASNPDIELVVPGKDLHFCSEACRARAAYLVARELARYEGHL